MKKISLALIILILVGICIPAVSAENILFEIPIEYTDTSISVVQPGNSQSYEPGFSINGIYFKNIELYDLVSYITIDIAGNKHKEGRYTASYSLGPHTDSAVIYVSHATNMLGAVTHTRYVIFPQNWNNAGLINAKTMTFSDFVFYTTYGRNDNVAAFHPSVCVASGGRYVSTTGTKSTVSVTSASIWTNQISVNQTDGMYEIILTRNLDGTSYPSTLTIKNDELIVYTHKGADDRQVFYADNEVTDIVINSGLKDYTYSLTSTPADPDDLDGSGITVYIKNSQTGALIANANVVIDALVDGDYYPVTNRTEPSGIFSINLQPTGGGKPNPDGYRLIATADGYNNPMPEINFTLGDYIKYFECFLDPIAGGPADENKTFIDFFVRDMSSNPISGATVKFGKYTLITNSAGYTVFEVDKNNNYSWTVSKSGYGALTGNAVIGNDPRHTINTVLAPIVTPTTTTPIPTSPPIGPTPTMTAPTGEHVSNWLEWFAAHFGMILGGGVEIGKIFMWLCFTVPVGVYVGKEAKAGAAGFMAGAGIVTLFFVLIGWVPIWLVVLLALIIGLLYAKVFNAQDNGGGR